MLWIASHFGPGEGFYRRACILELEVWRLVGISDRIFRIPTNYFRIPVIHSRITILL